MITPEEIIIKETAQEFLQKMTIAGDIFMDGADVNIELAEPQILIGEDGKTLLDFQRLLRMMLSKKIGKTFYIKLDINHYIEKKTENLKKMASEIADQVSLTRISKTLPPMSSYERRIIHARLAERSDVITQSQGEGKERCVIIAPHPLA
jgi:spoIIIJ-associated protein